MNMPRSPVSRTKPSLDPLPLLTRSATAKSNLYKDLDHLEESVNAEFRQYVADTLAAKDAFSSESVRTNSGDGDLLRALEHLSMVSNEELEDQQHRHQHASRESLVSGRDVEDDDEEAEETGESLPERVVSPGQYFGARSLPLESFNELWTDQQRQVCISITYHSV